MIPTAWEGLAPAPTGREGQLSLLESARALGSLRWLELEGHARLGALAAGGSLPPRTAVWASGASLAHAWRAEQLRELLPVSAGLPGVDESTRASASGGALARDLEVALRSADSGALSRWYRALSAVYAALSEGVGVAGGAPARRMLNRLAADADREAGEIAVDRAPCGEAAGTTPGSGTPTLGGKA
ncbi:MAG TPA: hypothetical protein VKU92_11320 [Acidimicrobiales bacterium]|nr:hypothetical protein [Acidimicrobiales bacterium]